MLDTIVSVLRATLSAIGLLALNDPAATNSLAAVVVVMVSIALLLGAAIAVHLHTSGVGSPAHPTRAAELAAPLTQCDPDAAGHIRRRGPGRAVSAA